MKDRLKLILQEYGLNSSRLAEILGVQRSGISHILSGRNKPGFDFIRSVLHQFPDIDANWLITGEGAMIKQVTGDDKTDQNSETGNLSRIFNESTRIKNEKVESESENKTDKISSSYKSKHFDFGDDEVESFVVLYRNGNFRIYRNN